MSRRIRVLAAVAAAWVSCQGAPASAEALPASRIPVIIDTDIGDDIDDAFALVAALHDPRFEVLGVTTAWGDTHLRARLVRRLLDAAGRAEVPVAEGPPTPNSTPFTQRQWALAGPDPAVVDAVAFLGDATRRRPGAITLLALAPLTNVQALHERDPGALKRFKDVAIMAGSIRRGYNIGGAIPTPTPHAEYNVVSAPAALGTLLASGVPVRMFPLDSTQVKFDEVRRDRLFAYGSGASDALALLYHQWRLLNGWGQLTPTLFDAVPVAWLQKPALCHLQPMRVEVDAKGYTRETAGTPNAEVCLAIEEGAVLDVLMDDLAPALVAGAP